MKATVCSFLCTLPDLERSGVLVLRDSPRVFVLSPDKKLYILFVKGIARVNTGTFAITMLAKSPVSIGPGGDILNRRIYFASGSHLYSWGVAD